MPATAIDTARILLVSREPGLSRSLQSLVGDQSWQIEQAFSGLEALERVEALNSANVILLDVRTGNRDALHTLRWLRRFSPEMPVILLCHGRNTREALEGLQLGARDCLRKPVTPHELEAVIKKQLEKSTDRAGGKSAEEQVDFIGEDCSFISASPAMRKFRAQAEMLAKVNVPVLIRGENGSGKDVVARLIHKLSPRRDSKFEEVHCAAFRGDSLESELFGYERGAFRGAAHGKHGKVELCDKGTILLGEVEHIPANAQAKLLQLLQRKQFYRVGGKTAIKTDVRILAATKGGIDRALAERQLREDLYYGLSAFTLHIPSLRQRKDEIPLLLEHFMHRMAKQYGLPPQTFSAELLESCKQYAWPGNLRELENFVKRYLVIGDESLALSELEPEGNFLSGKNNIPSNGDSIARHAAAELPSSLKSLVRNAKGETERSAIAGALEQTHWNRKSAARLLGISYRALLYKIQQYQMSPPQGYLSPFVTGHGAKGNGQAG